MYGDSIQDAEEALRLNLEDCEFLFGLVELDVIRADAALKLIPDDREALYLAASSCFAEKQLDKAREYAARGAEAISKAVPNDPRWESLGTAMQEILADVAIATGHPEDAVKSLQAAVDASGSPKLWWRLGSLQIGLGKFDAARQTMEGIRTKFKGALLVWNGDRADDLRRPAGSAE